MPEPLQSVWKKPAFKENDWVQCRSTRKHSDGKYRSAGWLADWKFQVARITQCSEGYNIYWPSTGNGVFEWDLVLPTEWDE